MTFSIVFVVVTLAVATCGVVFGRRYSVNGKILSRPARTIVSEYLKLPEQNRAIGSVDYLCQTLSSLDRYVGGNNAAKEHFMEHRYDGSTFQFGKNHNCATTYWSACVGFVEYDKIIRSIRSIADALERQKVELEKSSTGHSIEYAKAMAERLRDEANLIDTVTKEICS